MAKYARTAGGNWSADATWSTTSGGAADTVAPTSSDDVVFDANSGNVTMDATATAKTLTQTGYTNILTHTDGITFTALGNVTLLAGKYVSSGDLARISINTSATLVTGGNGIGYLFSSSGTLTLGDNYTGRAGPMAAIQTAAGAAINLNGKTVSGSSSTNRLLVRSYTIGSASNITVSGGTFANADFQDITFANGGSNLDLSAITGLSGDCGGNSMSGGGTLTFTTAETQTWKTAAGGNWSGANWTGASGHDRAPLPQDDVVMGMAYGASKTIISDMPRLGRSISWTGATGSPTWDMTSLSYTTYGSMTMISGMTITDGVNHHFYFQGRGAYTLTSAGKKLPSNGYCHVQMVGGSLTLQDNMNYSPTILYLDNGIFDANGHNVSTSTLNSYGSSTRTINMGSGTWTVTGIGNYTDWQMSSSGLTLNASTSTIAFTYAGTGAEALMMGAYTYNNITLAPGSGVFTFSGAFTFANMTMSSAGTKTVKFTKNTTYTMTGTSFLSGTATGNITITSDDSATKFTLTKTGGGAVSSDYLTIDYCKVLPVFTWYAGANSTDSGHNDATDHWIFTIPPLAAFTPLSILFTPGSITAIPLSEWTAVFSALSVLLTIPNITATYVGMTKFGYDSANHWISFMVDGVEVARLKENGDLDINGIVNINAF